MTNVNEHHLPSAPALCGLLLYAEAPPTHQMSHHIDETELFVFHFGNFCHILILIICWCKHESVHLWPVFVSCIILVRRCHWCFGRTHGDQRASMTKSVKTGRLDYTHSVCWVRHTHSTLTFQCKTSNCSFTDFHPLHPCIDKFQLYCVFIFVSGHILIRLR